MAVRGLAIVGDSNVNEGDNTHVDVAVKTTILGGDQGDFDHAYFSMIVPDLNPVSTATLNAAIASAVEAEMVVHGITFGLSDTVTVY